MANKSSSHQLFVLMSLLISSVLGTVVMMKLAAAPSPTPGPTELMKRLADTEMRVQIVQAEADLLEAERRLELAKAKTVPIAEWENVPELKPCPAASEDAPTSWPDAAIAFCLCCLVAVIFKEA